MTRCAPQYPHPHSHARKPSLQTVLPRKHRLLTHSLTHSPTRSASPFVLAKDVTHGPLNNKMQEPQPSILRQTLTDPQTLRPSDPQILRSSDPQTLRPSPRQCKTLNPHSPWQYNIVSDLVEDALTLTLTLTLIGSTISCPTSWKTQRQR